MNSVGQIVVTLAALIGFGRLFLADKGESHGLSGLPILSQALSGRSRCRSETLSAPPLGARRPCRSAGRLAR